MKKNSYTPSNPKKYSCYGLRKNSYKEFDNEKKIPTARKFPSSPVNFSNGPSLISPPFCFKIPNPDLQIREIPDPEKPTGDRSPSLGTLGMGAIKPLSLRVKNRLYLVPLSIDAIFP